MEMNRERFRLAAEALGKKPCLDLLYALHAKGRGSASTLAKETGLHTATAMKYLRALDDAGILESHTEKGKTRDMIVYSITESRIDLSLNLSGKKEEGYSLLAEDLIKVMLAKVQRTYGDAPEPPPTKNPYDLYLLLEDRYGKESALDITFGAISSLEKKGEDMCGLDRLLPFISKGRAKC